MPRVLLLLPTTTYRTSAFLAAAAQLGVDVTVASEQPNTLADLNRSALLTLDFSDPAACADRVIEFNQSYPVEAVIAVDSQVSSAAAAIAAELGLPSNSLASVAAANNKQQMRQLLAQADVPSPNFRLCRFDDDRAELAQQTDFPCVIKPLALAASQGVMRADDPAELLLACQRLEQILACGSLPAADQFLLEEFVSGPEVALEGIVTAGQLRVLALLDKPVPMDGPFFEETIYTTPSRHPAVDQQAVRAVTQQAIEALGLTHGPLHAELRLSDTGPVVIEVNPRSIGGLCSRVLRFGTGLSLEELIIHHALDSQFVLPDRQGTAAGVMMIPTPAAGRLERVTGLEQAQSIDGIEEVTISVHVGKRLVPLPEGSEYLGFIFARGDTPELVQQALEDSHACLHFEIQAEGGPSC